MKKSIIFIICMVLINVMLVGCSNKNSEGVRDITSSESQQKEAEEMESEELKEVTFNINSDNYDENYSNADYVYSYETKDNKGATIVGSNVKNLTDEIIVKDAVFRFDFIKGGNVIESYESYLLDDALPGEYGFINLYSIEISMSDFDTINISMISKNK